MKTTIAIMFTLLMGTCVWVDYKQANDIRTELVDCPYFSMDSTVKWLNNHQNISELGANSDVVTIYPDMVNHIQLNDFLLVEIDYPYRTYILYSASQIYPPVIGNSIQGVIRKRLKHDWR